MLFKSKNAFKANNKTFRRILWKELINQKRTTNTKFMVLEKRWEQRAAEDNLQDAETKVAKNSSESRLLCLNEKTGLKKGINTAMFTERAKKPAETHWRFMPQLLKQSL